MSVEKKLVGYGWKSTSVWEANEEMTKKCRCFGRGRVFCLFVSLTNSVESQTESMRCSESLLRTHSVEDRSSTMLCDACGEAIELGDEVEARNFGEKALHYHKECFRKLWL